MPPDLHSYLACPRCGLALAAGDGLVCTACRVEYPVLGGVPWLFADPAAAIAQWRQRFDYQARKLDADADAARRALAADDLGDVTRSRLKTLAAGLAEQRAEIAALLAPMGLDTPLANLETHLALRTRLPPELDIVGYLPNVHRDWCWGDAENAAALDAVAAVAGERPTPRIAVLGAGAGRLAFDVHHRMDAALTLALDINPLLSYVDHRVASGATVALHEFPLAPREAHDVAVARTLRAPHPANAGYAAIVADGRRPPLAPGLWDLVLTPWYVDIVDVPFPETCALVNRLLKPGGRWVSFGSIAFSAPAPDARLTRDEMLDIVTRQGFAVAACHETVIPYLCSPASRHGRREEVFAFGAEKKRETAPPRRHEALPDWIVEGKAAVPLAPAFRLQAGTTRIHAYIMSLIDGRRSLEDMAAELEQNGLMPRREARTALRGFLIKMFDESRRA